MYKCFVLFSFTMKDSRLEDSGIVRVCFARQGRSWVIEGGCKRHLQRGSRLLPKSVEPVRSTPLGEFSLHCTYILTLQCLLKSNCLLPNTQKSAELNSDLPVRKMLSPYSLCCCRSLFQKMMYFKKYCLFAFKLSIFNKHSLKQCSQSSIFYILCFEDFLASVLSKSLWFVRKIWLSKCNFIVRNC